MSQVSVTIDGRKYRLACNPGEEARLESLAGLIDEKIGEMRKTFGEIGDQRLVIMAALTIADNLTEARDEAAAERKRSEEAERRAQAMASTIDALGSRIEFDRDSPRRRRGGLSRPDCEPTRVQSRLRFNRIAACPGFLDFARFCAKNRRKLFRRARLRRSTPSAPSSSRSRPQAAPI